MNIEPLIDLIERSDLPQLQKQVNKGFVIRALDAETERRRISDIIKALIDNVRIDEVVISTEEVIIYKVLATKDEWDIKYPFRLVMNIKDKWVKVSEVCDTLDYAILIYLATKHNQKDSGFPYFAERMLGIPERKDS